MSLTSKRFMSVIAILLFGIALFAQAAETVAADAAATEAPPVDWLRVYMSGHIWSHLIVVMLILTLTLAFIKFKKLYGSEKVDAKKFYLKMKGHIRNENYEEAIEIAKQFKETTIGYIFWNGLLAFNDERKQGKKGKDLRSVLQNSFDEAGMQLIPKIESMIYWFDIIAQISTLLGLLGTIFGLIQAFNALGQPDVDQATKQSNLTNGIMMAMGTTAAGLIVAIPTMFIKGVIQGRAEKIIGDIDEYSVKAINQINYSIKE